MEKMNDKILAVISIAVLKTENSVSVMMKQVKRVPNGFIFETPVAIAARDSSGYKDARLSKLEDIENDKIFVAADPLSGELLVQIDTRRLAGGSAAAYIILYSGERIIIPLIRVGSLLKGRLNKIPEDIVELYIEEE